MGYPTDLGSCYIRIAMLEKEIGDTKRSLTRVEQLNAHLTKAEQSSAHLARVDATLNQVLVRLTPKRIRPLHNRNKRNG